MKPLNDLKAISSSEKVWKQSLLAPLILLAVRDYPSDMTVICYTIDEITNFTLSYNATSVYRTLRRLHKLGLIKLRLANQPDRPAYKIYSLSKLGEQELREFISVINNSSNFATSKPLSVR